MYCDGQVFYESDVSTYLHFYKSSWNLSTHWHNVCFFFLSLLCCLKKKDTGVLLEIEIQSTLKAVQSMDQKKSVSLLYVHLETVFSHFNGFWSGLYKGFFGVQDCRKISLLGWSVALWFVLLVHIICN